MKKLLLAFGLIFAFSASAETSVKKPNERIGEIIVYDNTKIHPGAHPNDEMSDESRARWNSYKGLQMVYVITATITEIKNNLVTFNVENKGNDIPGSEVQTSNGKQQINCKTHKFRGWIEGGPVYGTVDGVPTDKPIRIEKPGWGDWENTSRPKGDKKEGESGYFERKMCV